MIGLFAGTAPAAPSGKANGSSAQSTADGFGATLLEAVGAAVPGGEATGTADAATPAAPTTPPTADEIFAALTTGFAGTEAAPSVDGALAVEDGPADETVETDDTETDAAAPVLADTTAAADAPPAPPVAALPPAALPAQTPAVPPAVVAQTPVTAPAEGAGATADTAVTPLSAATAPVVTTAVAAAAPRGTTTATAAADTAATPAAAEPTPAAVTTSAAAAPTAAPAAALPTTPVAPTAAASPAAAAPVVTALPAALPATEAAAPTTPDTGAEAVELVALPKDAPVAAPVAFAPAASTTTAVTGAAASAPLPAQPTPLATQVAGPIFTLAAAGNGEHVMTVDITPDNLGPITVRAHVGADGVRVELFAPNDVAREALRSILPDIRKDMGGAGLGSNLDLSSQNQPTDRGDGGQQRRQPQQGEALALLDQQTNAARPWLLTDPSTTIDVMA